MRASSHGSQQQLLPEGLSFGSDISRLVVDRVGLRGGDIVFQHVTVFVLQGRVWLARHRKLREVRRGLGFRRLGFRVWARS